ncbi:hypothetical protein [Archangium sp.]|uniref:hypothetical protein n=1 Tax=Archangium sp. TaxID=1872627 RepID=UPI00286D488F|nr:hypothetical protein [Archangium sp.]
MRERDLADLLAYLHRLGDDLDPGVDEDRLVLGAALLKAGVFALVGNVRTGPRVSDKRLEAEEVPLVAPVGLSEGGAESGTEGRVGLRGGFIVKLEEGSGGVAPVSDWIALSP